jgi:hypothetical protein
MGSNVYYRNIGQLALRNPQERLPPVFRVTRPSGNSLLQGLRNIEDFHAVPAMPAYLGGTGFEKKLSGILVL